MLNRVIFLTNGPAQSTADIKSFGGVISFFVPEELERRGIPVVREDFKHWFDLDSKGVLDRIHALPDADAILLCKPLSTVRKFGRRFNTPAFIRPLLKKSKTKKIYTILGATPKTGIGHEHAFTMARPTDTRIHWAADPLRCYPEQPTDQINILVDHWKPHRKEWNAKKRKTREQQYANMFSALHKLKYEKLVNIDVKVLNRNPPEIDLLNYTHELPDCTFKSWGDVVPYYRKSHIFCVTDPEEVGLSVIENAMCGSFIFLMNSGYLPDNFQTQIRCCGGTGFSSMYAALEYAVENIDVIGTRKMAKQYTWKAVVDTVLSVITNHLAIRGCDER